MSQPQPQTPTGMQVTMGNTKLLRWKAFYKKLAKNKAALVGAFIIIAVVILGALAPVLATHDPNTTNVMNKLQGPSAEHYLGTDEMGRDIFSRLLYGTKISLGIGFLSTFLGAIVGVALGVIAGYYGRWIDSLIMRISDVLLAFPGILLALAIVSVLGASTRNVIIAVAFMLSHLLQGLYVGQHLA